MQNNAPMEFYSIIRERRMLLDITQQDLADISSVSLRAIKSIENGKGNPSVDTLRKLANALGIEIIMRVREMPK